MGFENREMMASDLQLIAIVLVGLISIPVLWIMSTSKKLTKKRELKLKDKLFVEMFIRNEPKKTDGNQIPVRE